MKYESELLSEIIANRGHEKSSIHYESECKEAFIEECRGSYPKLCDYESEWLNYMVENPIGEFPYETITAVTEATINNVVPLAFKSAILKGSTKYRDIDTGEFLDTFDETKNLELVSVQMPVLTTTGKNLFTGKYSDFSDGSYGSFKYGEIGKNYTISLYDNDTNVSLDGISFGASVKGNEGNTLNWMTNGNEIYIKQLTKNTLDAFTIRPNNEENLHKIMQRFNIQIEENSVATSYEPHKSNILTVNEEVELGSVGDTRDTLNLITGEVVISTYDYTITGDEDWRGGRVSDTVSGAGYRGHVYLSALGIPSFSKTTFVSDKFKKNDWGNGVFLHPQQIIYFTVPDELEVIDSDLQLKDFIKRNSGTIKYTLPEKSIKTVDLSIVNQDGQSVSKLIPFEGTMYMETDGQPLKPLLSAEVPVEAITQNLSSFINEGCNHE